ncbi:MAG: glycosyltransferase, partial [Candidatus Latescibacteria bacterium]|nr:glycosyltransferase [Candidatus Latescibacterota bacterium]
MHDIVENPQNIKSADIIVGIPSLNEADNIAFPTDVASRGLRDFFPEAKSVIINVDNNSNDGTGETFMSTPTQQPKIYISTPEGVKGKGNNLRNLFRASVELNAKFVVVVDADLKSITPGWIRYLGEPLMGRFDYVTPIYVRHKYDGTITNHIAYPMIRTLGGLRVRQPIGGDFG